MSLTGDFWLVLAATLAVVLVAGLGLALGSFFGRPPPRGSCGGLASGSCACAAGKPQDGCGELAARAGTSRLPTTDASALSPASSRHDSGVADHVRR